MFGLLIYCYATGTFSSRKIEKLTDETLVLAAGELDAAGFSAWLTESCSPRD